MATMVYPLLNKYFVGWARIALGGVGGDQVLQEACVEAFGADFTPAPAPSFGDTKRLWRSMDHIIAKLSLGE
jgi:hypothetical protein